MVFGIGFGAVAASTGGISSSWASWNGSADGSNIDTMQVGTGASVIAISATTFMIITPNGNSLWAYIGTVSGTSIVYGSIVDLNGNGSSAPSSIKNISVEILDVNKVLISYGTNSNNNIYVVCATVSGTTITNGSVVIAVSGNASVDHQQQLAILTTTTALLAWRDNSTNIKAVVLSVSGTTITAATAANIVSGIATAPSVMCYTSGKVLVLYPDANNFPTARIVNVAGTTIGTLGTPVNLVSSALGGINEGYLAFVDSGTLIAIYQLADTVLYGVVLSPSGNTVGVNAIATINSATMGTDSLWIEPLNSIEYMVAYRTSPLGTNLINARVLTLSGTTLTPHSQIQIQSGGSDSITYQNLTKMDANTVINGVAMSSTAQAKVLKRA